MDELLPYYERELSYLRRYSEDFAQRYPKIAGRLWPVGEQSDDCGETGHPFDRGD